MKKILIVEDDKDINNLICAYCKAEGMKPVQAFSGNTGLRLFLSEQPDIALLDIMLPEIDGFELCRLVRAESDIPVIMISSIRDEKDKLSLYSLGADDYIEKPFSPKVLMAKISALLRRSSGEKEEAAVCGDIVLNSSARTCTKGGVPLELSKLEFDILSCLILNKNQVMSRERIFDNVWGADDFGDISTVTVHIKKIRDKIENDPSNPQIIRTIRGIGYVVRD